LEILESDGGRTSTLQLPTPPPGVASAPPSEPSIAHTIGRHARTCRPAARIVTAARGPRRDAARNKDWSIGRTLAKLEQYNGLGYAARGRPSPYIWSGTDQYRSGKYVRDGVYDPNVVDSQPGCAGLLMAMMALDPTITFTGVTIAPSISVKPIPAEKPAAPSIANPAKGSIGAFIANIFNAVFKRKS
jgi:hypothetical protein